MTGMFELIFTIKEAIIFINSLHIISFKVMLWMLSMCQVAGCRDGYDLLNLFFACVDVLMKIYFNSISISFQVLNLFLALLLSSFGAESFQHSQEDSETNKLQEAIDRINRFYVLIKSHLWSCTIVKIHTKPISHDDALNSSANMKTKTISNDGFKLSNGPSSRNDLTFNQDRNTYHQNSVGKDSRRY